MLCEKHNADDKIIITENGLPRDIGEAATPELLSKYEVVYFDSESMIAPLLFFIYTSIFS